MFAIFSPRRERRVIDTQADAPFVRCRAELVRILPDLLLV
jgi:hypothetical protein